MKECIFCGVLTSFKFEGEGEYAGEIICPKCQSDKLHTSFLGCSNKKKCSVHIKRV